MGAARARPPAGLIAAAEQEYQARRDELAALLPVVRELLDRDGVSEIETVTDVWLTLMHNPSRTAALLSATAIVQLAKGLPEHHGERV